MLIPTPLVSAKREVKVFQIFSEKGRSDSRVLGVSSSYPDINNLVLLQGSFFMPFDEDAVSQVCVLGITAKHKLFGFGDVIGKRIKINDQWMMVIGVLGDANLGRQEFEGVKIQNPNNDIYIPITTSLKKFNVDPLENELNEAVIQVGADGDLREQSAAISNLMATMHAFIDDYSLIVPEKLLVQNQRTQGIFNIVMGAIASISLLVGGIGIMNIMLASVLERTSEIGLRRAIGARKRDIREQFIAEALGLSLAGGIIGVGFGFAISRLVAAYSGWSTIITPESIALSFGVSSVVGLIFGIYPAVQASNLDPIECLHYE